MPKIHRTIPPLTEQDRQRYWTHIDMREPDQCWPWKQAVEKTSYGRFWIGKHYYQASRVGYFLRHGVDPGEMETCHRCDYPPCSNPQHFFQGTARDNAQDKVKRVDSQGVRVTQ